MTWVCLSAIVCSAATLDLCGWPLVAGMFAGALILGDD